MSESQNVTDHSEAVESFSKVKQAVEALRSEYAKNGEGIAKLSADMAALPKMRAPFEDVKQAMLDLVDVFGERYAANNVRSALIEFATNEKLEDSLDTSERVSEKGKPLRLETLERAFSEPESHASNVQLLQPSKLKFNDFVLHALSADLVKSLIERALSSITPADFGYQNVNQSEIGPARAEMNNTLAVWQVQLDTLEARQGVIRAQLQQLGFSDI